MNNIAGGPTVDRTPTGGGETLALTSAQVAEEPRGDPAMVETFTPRVGAAASESKVTEEPHGDPVMVETFNPRVGAATLESKVGETSQEGRCRSPVMRGQDIQLIRPSMNLPVHQTQYLVMPHL